MGPAIKPIYEREKILYCLLVYKKVTVIDLYLFGVRAKLSEVISYLRNKKGLKIITTGENQSLTYTLRPSSYIKAVECYQHMLIKRRNQNKLKNKTMNCKNCNNYTPTDGQFGACNIFNREAITRIDEPKVNMLYPYEYSDIVVGENFGCIHFENKLE